MAFLLALLFALVVPSGLRADSPVTVTVRPGKVYIARGEGGRQHLNFDLVLANSGEKLIINKIELTAYDREGKVSYRTFTDEYGRKSVELAERPAIEKQGTAMLYTPFHTFPAGVPLDKLRYEFAFSTEDRKQHFETAIEVFPIAYTTKTDLIVPIRGRVLVWDGHDYESHHRRVDYTQEFFRKIGQRTNFQRFAYDFVVVDDAGAFYKGDKRLNDDWYRAGKPGPFEDYYTFGVPVVAAGAGKVVRVRDDFADDHAFTPDDLKTDERGFFGNYVVIDHLNGEFSLFGHLKRGSVRVKAGQTVKQGEVIAAAGSTGSSLFPHLHYELRDGDGAREVEGLPSEFSDFQRVLGARREKVRKGAINTGDIVFVAP